MRALFVRFALLCSSMLVADIASAQVFGGETSAQSSTPSFQAEKTVNTGFSRPKAQPAAPLKSLKEETSDDQASSDEAESQEQASPSDFFMPEDATKPAEQNVRKTGGTAHLSIKEEGEDEKEGNIFLYYTDFSLGHFSSTQVSCSMRFIIYTTLKKKLTSIALRLRWPKLTTKLDYEDVEPGVAYHLDYTFFGNGCYSVDKLPNVTINRCRLKGKTQQQCAGLFRLTEKPKN